MAYQSGDTILDNHYNDFATSVNAIWGTGSGDHGYGQTNTVSSVSTSSTVQASQWTTLLARMTSCASHQGSSITGISNPSAGNTISAFTALSGNVTTINTNRLNVSSRAGNVESSCSTTTNLITSIEQRGRWTWGSTDQARFFFNTGGRISCRWDISGYTSDTKAERWNTLASNCGTYLINAQSSGKSGGGGNSPNINNTNLGWHDLTGSYQDAFRQYAQSTYTNNNIRLQLYKSGAVVYFRSYWNDDEADQTSWNKSIYNVQDQTNGTKQTFFGHEESETTHIADTWGDGPSQSVDANG
tara:strand:- start:18 stop:917 length:900 start_codon:yes stop_codon:yes gene_type:complete